METQEAVTTPAEPTVETESAPVEQQTVESSQTPEVSEPQKKVSETVPYDRFKEVNDRLKQMEDYVASVQAPQIPDTGLENTVPELDPDAARAVDALVEQKLEARKAAEFARKHQAEFESNRLLAALVKDIIAEHNAKGQVVDQEDALALAKKELESNFAPKVTEAKTEGYQEGQQITQQKQQLGAVGDTTKASPKVDPNSLSADEFATYYGIPRVN